MKKPVVIAVLLVLAVGVGSLAAVLMTYAHFSYRRAEELAAHQLWPQARQRLTRYLWIHPGDARARLLMADALVKDDSLPVTESATQAIAELSRIPDDSPMAAEARFQEGGFWFLLLQKPGRGEQRLRKSIELGADARAYQLLWTLLNFTGRSEESEEIFWRGYELSLENERPLRLRDLFLSQFFPSSAHEYLERRMGVLAPQEAPSRMSESQRYLRFRQREPEVPANHAAVAQWCQQEGDPEFADRVLNAAKDLPGAQSDAFFLSASIATQLDLGQFDQAKASMQRWPKSNRGHSYWKLRALVLDEAYGDYQAALSAYQQALDLWPGPVDLKLHHRQAVCLTRAGRTDEAAAAKQRIVDLRALLTDETLDRLRDAVTALDNPEQLDEVARFYRSLGRPREADGWESYIRRLRDVES